MAFRAPPHKATTRKKKRAPLSLFIFVLVSLSLLEAMVWQLWDWRVIGGIAALVTAKYVWPDL